nr:ribonuclease H-like domain-containing protein [Tanacetum cinerariifolium]
MDLFGPTFVKSLNNKSYYLVIIDDYSRFTWVFSVATKDETSPILKIFITGIENQLSLKNRVLVTKPHSSTPYELLLGRIPSIGFMKPFGCLVTILNTIDPLGKFDGKADEGFLVGYSEPEFEGKKPESEVHVSPTNSAKTKKHDDKTTKEAKGKSLVELSTGYRNLSAEIEDFSDNNINEVNAASTSVPAIGQISTTSTNTFSAVGPSNTVVSPTHGKSSYVDTSQYPNDPNMPALEDITYSVLFQQLEFIPVRPIPTTRVHKDHHEELLQFKMQKVWVLVDLPNGKRAIGFKDPDYPDKVYKVVKALYGLHQALRAWYETLANYLLENDLCKAFEKLMKDKFQISLMGELTFFLDGKLASTPKDTEKPLLKDPDGEDIDVHTYR